MKKKLFIIFSICFLFFSCELQNIMFSDSNILGSWKYEKNSDKYDYYYTFEDPNTF